MMDTGEYHKKSLMALCTCSRFVRFLHTQVNHIVLHNGNKILTQGIKGLNALKVASCFSTGPAQGQLPSHSFDLHQRSLLFAVRQ